ncbi:MULTISPECIES: hypothetical protein [unclassified Mucilaginibacter]|uniref:hypothetical protein n=1 Tax=unclassified Mucilaginibacter TaxID=2617802 RepID=UPI002AC9DE5D|nr:MULTISPECIES: hypothetical protein [unclassified Mucilaginibacter]MEB0263148.1 hypothetical protein [Mucilaginibacter sp. 10I4]MEB0280274.1 hypothetical protein [Mucilaginibacter sp. 10B2]MEB0300219.1 hypothetical protein [Mucilaginibacter sp. 5C4]WPX25577.1 hypothetical protein RHM67_09890 [Mucilaginibacter sp. 5C4]
MKKLLLTAITSIFIFGAAQAQIGKGHKFIGGSFNFSYDEDGTSQNYNFDSGVTRYSNYKTTNFNISPEFGFFIGDKWTIGIQPGYSRVSGTETSNFYSATTPASNYSYTSKYHTDILGLAVNLRYYCMINEKLGFYPQMGVSTSHLANDFSNGHFAAYAGPNVVFFPSSKVGLNMGFGNISYQYNYLSHGSFLNASLNNNFNFGINYYFGGK